MWSVLPSRDSHSGACAWVLVVIGKNLASLASRWRSLCSRQSFAHVGSATSSRVALLDRPVEDIVILEALAHEEIAEELAEVRVVRLIVEAQCSAVVEVDAKSAGIRVRPFHDVSVAWDPLVRESTAKELCGRGHLLLHNAVVLLLLGGSLETLPGERPSEEVHEDISQRFHVVSTGLLCAKQMFRYVLLQLSSGSTHLRPSGC